MDIIIKNLYKSFGDNIIFQDFSLLLEKNSTTCIMGESGLGKTTLFNIILSIVKKDSGFVTSLSKKKISVVFQEDRLIQNITVKSNLNFVLNNKLSDDELNYYLKQLNLENILYKKVNDLSGGMKRRVSLLRGILYNGDIYIMDEPFKGLDEETKINVIDFFNKNTINKTKIIITHDFNEANLLNGKNIDLGDLAKTIKS